ncbi:MAG TPA: hypothetical protein VIY73_17615 [Polyangiaceae bacterium]
MLRARAAAAALTSAVAAAFLAAACAKPASDSSVLASQDLVSFGGQFDPDEILAPGPMQDANALDANAVQGFLEQPPYGSASFLAEYSSNGVLASQAIAAAAQRYTIDPIVLLVRAEMDQGLVAAGTYPSPPSRVEYAFGCGCSGPGDCDPTYAGFDVQVACLASTLRDDLDAVAANGTTADGWGPGVTSATLDGAQVTPADDSTSALYEYTPFVKVGQPGGNWLFWNLWNAFSAAVGYSSPEGGTTADSWIGAACVGSGTCVYEGTPGTCATEFPGGLCTLSCQGTCPSASGEPSTFCADFGSEGGFCLAACNQADPQCRNGYTCENVKQFGDTATSQFVCFPQ